MLSTNIAETSVTIDDSETTPDLNLCSLTRDSHCCAGLRQDEGDAVRSQDLDVLPRLHLGLGRERPTGRFVDPHLLSAHERCGASWLLLFRVAAVFVCSARVVPAVCGPASASTSTPPNGGLLDARLGRLSFSCQLTTALWCTDSARGLAKDQLPEMLRAPLEQICLRIKVGLAMSKPSNLTEPLWLSRSADPRPGSHRQLFVQSH